MEKTIEHYTEELDELLFNTMHKYAVDNNLSIQQESKFDKGRIVITVKGLNNEYGD